MKKMLRVEFVIPRHVLEDNQAEALKPLSGFSDILRIPAYRAGREVFQVIIDTNPDAKDELQAALAAFAERLRQTIQVKYLELDVEDQTFLNR